MSNPYQETHYIDPTLYETPYVTYKDLVQIFEHTELLPIARSGQSISPGEISYYTGKSLEHAGIRVVRPNDSRDGYVVIEDLLDVTPRLICDAIHGCRGDTCQGSGIGKDGDKRIRNALEVWKDPVPVFEAEIERRSRPWYVDYFAR
jgi:hypothetical protein